MGAGPATGRGMGPCGSGAARGFRRGGLRGRGFGAGFRGFPFRWGASSWTETEEKKTLEEEEKALKQELEEIQKEKEALEKK